VLRIINKKGFKKYEKALADACAHLVHAPDENLRQQRARVKEAFEVFMNTEDTSLREELNEDLYYELLIIFGK